VAYNSINKILDICNEKDISFYKAVMLDTCNDMELDEKQVFDKMTKMWQVMCEASISYDKDLKSRSGLVGGNGALMEAYAKSHKGFCGDFMLAVMVEALKMGESNACMKRIVAAPTAGSCGVMPAVLIAVKRMYGESDENIVKSMIVAAGIGQVIASRAFIAGATGGCQAEIGAAAAMSAGALVMLKNGKPNQIANAVAMTLKNMLGLVCDPVAGLVEVPCVKRNVSGAANAVTCAEMALAGIESAIPVDQVIDAMREVGENMSPMYKETACGGCANTPRGLEIKEFLNS
jgi:L-serine dehydratase